MSGKEKKFINNKLGWFYQAILISNILLLVIPINLLSFIPIKARAAEPPIDEISSFIDAEPEEGVTPDPSDFAPGYDGSGPGEILPPLEEEPAEIQSLKNTFIANTKIGMKENDSTSFLWMAENISQNPKLVFNSSDEQDLRIMYCLGSVIPDYANNPDSLAVATGNALEYILDLQADQPEKYQELVEKAQEGARQQIVSRLKHDVANFACIAGVDQTMAAEMLQYNTEEVDAIINYAQNKIVIDRRVLELLVNLVTPKDQGGAGHERIKVYRIRRGYDRDAKMYSRESEATYQALRQERENQVIQTINDVTKADRSDLATDPAFSNAEALGAVTDAAGRSQGDLIFSNAEDNQNISAHWRGEAVDISEVDSIKCTLIKKKRIGSDTKIKQPATPIKLAWQTSDGYDASPPPDWSSLNSNLKDLSTAQYLDLLDEFGIDADYGEDLSDANFSDIVGLIGNSLIGEILNSPGNSLSGFSLADTAKKIGALVLADMFDLPREALLDSDLLDLKDLEQNIGEANFETKLNLPYGSLRGENLGQILTHTGIRYVENELGVPEGTITPGMDPQTLQLTIGRRVIEDQLYLEKGTFQNNTTYNKLKDVAGRRKIEMIFATPSMIDERLGIDFGITENYMSGGKSPDTYATLVGAKKLQDGAYLFRTAGASGNALGLAVNLQTADPDTTTASQRFVDLMAGNTSEEFFKNLGMERIAQGLSVSSNVRVAIMQWLQTNSLSSQTNCTIPTQINITIPKPGSTTGETIKVTIPEDQIMTSFGLRRGDLARLFGCYKVQPNAVFRALGEKALWTAVRNSSLVEKARARFLADHPEIANVLRTIDFYVSRFEEIKTTAEKIGSDWQNFNDSDPVVVELKDLLFGANGVYGILTGVDVSGLSIENVTSHIRDLRQVPVIADRILYLIGTAQTSSNQTLREKVNSTLLDVTTIIHDIDEIISGEEQPMISTLQIGDIKYSGSNGTGSGGGVGINRATLILMLSGRLSPKDFLISIGSNRVEDALGLPANSVMYFAKYLLNPNHDKNDIKGAFFRSVGQAQVEETFNMPPFFFQGDYPGASGSLTDIKENIAKSFSISESEAGARIMRALNLPGSFSSIESNRISGLSQVVAAAAKADEKLQIKTGTTAEFLNGEPLNKETLSNTENRIIAGRLDLPEAVIDKFERVKNGEEDLSKAKENQFLDISYNNHNEYANKPKEQSTSGELANQCPIHFNFEQHGAFKFSISPYIENNSYVYTDADGAHSFTSIDAARKYQSAETNQSKKVDFVKAIANSLAQRPDGSVDTTKADDNVNKIESFLQDKNAAEAFPDTNLVAMHDQYGIPLDTLETMMDRKEIKDIQIYNKPYNAFLEYVGQKTAERKVISTLLSSFAITLAGERIDATDIFDLLNGNGMQVAYRIGARYLEKQLDISNNLISQILEAPNDILRRCSMAEIGGNLIGSVFGVKNVSLDGNIYENIGGAKIEETLNLPSRSFRGATLEELINNVGSVKFARAFGLAADSTITPAMDDLSDFAANDPMYRQSPQEEMFREAEEYLEHPTGDVSEEELMDASQQVGLTAAAEAARIAGETEQIENPATPQEYRENQSRAKPEIIDGMLGLSQGTTRKLLGGQITPDQYRRDVAEKVLAQLLITNATGWLLKQFGLGNEYSSYFQAGNIYNLIKSCDSLTSRTCNRAGIFNSFEQMFGINLDAKMNLPDGTIARIIQDPKRAASELITSALMRLDHSLGLDPKSDASFAAAYSAMYGNNGSNYRDCETNPTTCLRTTTNEGVVVHSGPFPHTENRWQYYGEQIGTQLIGNWLVDLGIIAVPSPTSGPYAGFPNTQALVRESAAMLIRGDLRILGINAAIRSLNALHIYNGSSSPNLPSYYRITYEDVYYAFMGNPVLEAQYVNRATDNFLYNYSTGNPPQFNLTENSEMGSGTTATYGSQCPPGVAAGTDGCYDPNVPGSDFNPYENFDSYYTQSPNHIPAGLVPPGTEAQVQQDPLASESLAQVQEEARNKARSDIRNNLMWRMADAKLYQLDDNIPPGFARTMFEGTGKQRTMMLLAYAENALRDADIEIGGISVGELLDMKDLIIEVVHFFDNPAGYDLDSFVRSGKMATVDGWLSSKFSGFLGFDLAPGTFTSLFYGIKTGSFTNDVTIAGTGGQTITIQSITHLYTDWAISKVTSWADKALGLPPGTVFTAYKMYRNIQAAKTALATAKGAEQIATARANLAELKAELITFIISIVFAKQIAAVESALGLVPGTGAMLVGIAVSWLLTGAINPWAIAIFVIVNLFGVYKVELKCTADGYYPSIESPPDPSKYDNPELGVFNGFDNNVKKEKFIQSAQYKARTLAGDALMLSERTGDELAIPSQIMVGRQEDVDYWNYKIDEVICSTIGGCAGTRAGMWKNPQTTFYTHIGF